MGAPLGLRAVSSPVVAQDKAASVDFGVDGVVKIAQRRARRKSYHLVKNTQNSGMPEFWVFFTLG
ncbi:MAG: hypothetical protein AAFN79_18770 [Pseudomonadota bacterium]